VLFIFLFILWRGIVFGSWIMGAFFYKLWLKYADELRGIKTTKKPRAYRFFQRPRLRRFRIKGSNLLKWIK
jgi:hypothetical protein